MSLQWRAGSTPLSLSSATPLLLMVSRFTVSCPACPGRVQLFTVIPHPALLPPRPVLSTPRPVSTKPHHFHFIHRYLIFRPMHVTIRFSSSLSGCGGEVYLKFRDSISGPIALTDSAGEGRHIPAHALLHSSQCVCVV